MSVTDETYDTDENVSYHEEVDLSPLYAQQVKIRRLVVLGVISIILIFTLTMPVRTYIQGWQQTISMRKQNQKLSVEIKNLEAENNRRDNNNWIIDNARQRMGMVFPGETPYRVTDPSDTSKLDDKDPNKTSDDKGPAWYQNVWHNISVPQ